MTKPTFKTWLLAQCDRNDLLGRISRAYWRWQDIPAPEGSGGRRIPLVKGKYAIVDDDDFEWASQYDWHLGRIDGKDCVVRYEERDWRMFKIYLHDEIVTRARAQAIAHDIRCDPAFN